MKSTIDRLIINSPYEEPAHYWSYDRETRFFTLKEGRRPAGYVIASESSKAFDDPGKFIEIPLVNKIRPRIKAWRESGYPGVTGITKRLLEHWHNPEEREHRRFFFCQFEAIETQDKTKREFLDEWVKAVNQHEGFGIWQWSVSKYPADVAEILEKASEV